jgi:hypothetical protein
MVLVEVNKHDLGTGIQHRRDPVHEYGDGYPVLVSETLGHTHPIKTLNYGRNLLTYKTVILIVFQTKKIFC